MATTPSPQSPSALRVPDAPLHGAGYDTFEPYPTRHSARLASQRASREKETTPPISGSPQRNGSPKKARKLGESILSTPTSRSALQTNQRRGTPAASLINDESANSHFNVPSHPRSSASNALPTPAKTPSKKKVTSNLSSTSRALFPTAPKMSGRKQGPFSLESFEEDHAPSRNIEIFTDSRDRIPEASTDQLNPFNMTPAQPPRTPSPRRVTRASQKDLDLESNDAMNFMFRGKRVVKRMVEDDESDDPDDLGLFATRPDLLPDTGTLDNLKSLRRDDVKPRMLWERKDKPRSKNAKKESSLEDEATDDEDVFKIDPKASSTVPDDVLNAPGPRASPTREGFDDRITDNSPSGTKAEGNTTESSAKRPFANWMRKKKPDEISPASTPAKRGPSGDAASPHSLPSAKRTRASARH